MKQGFITVAAATPDIRVADVDFNTGNIIKLIEEASLEGAKIIVFPELCITGYTCSDLFFQDALIESANKALDSIILSTAGKNLLVFVGLPFMDCGKLYNVAAAISGGKLLGLTTKSHLPNYDEFYEKRQFYPGPGFCRTIVRNGEEIPFGPCQLYQCPQMENLMVSAEICEDLWAPKPPSIDAALNGATIIVNLSASNELVGKSKYRRDLVSGQSARLICGYIYANAGFGESTTDIVFGGHNIIAENGAILEESAKFSNEIIYSEIDVKRLISERRKNTTFSPDENEILDLPVINFDLKMEDTVLTRVFPLNPFVPQDERERDARCEEILTIQASGLKKRLMHTNAKTAVVGISGGLDSTLALLVMTRAFDMLHKDRSNITAITMPCFGTTDRTYKNACTLTESLGCTLKEIPIADAVKQHFHDIGQDINIHDVTFENSQARERTQVLMDYANKTGGILVGTGDLSELALGWATYNGDHMSMYGVNVGVPKTLVRHLVKYYADTCDNEELRDILTDVLNTPVSPELLPPEDGKIAQKTEELVGPYELHDFFLYYVLRFGYEPSKIYRIAKETFDGIYDDTIILKWLRTFYRRFFSQQFKRSCLPDGPKVGTVALSPRGDLRMPSDAVNALWLKDLSEL